MSSDLYIKQRDIDMNPVLKSLLIAAAMLLTSVFADFDTSPAALAEAAPFLWLAFVPWALAGQRSGCALAGAER